MGVFFLNTGLWLLVLLDDVVVGMRMAQYVSGMCHHHVCHIYTCCLHHTYLARKLCRHSRLPVISTRTTSGRHLEECVLLLSSLTVVCSECWILSPDKTEWRLISATLCGWRRYFVADQLWLMTRIREEEEELTLGIMCIFNWHNQNIEPHWHYGILYCNV